MHYYFVPFVGSAAGLVNPQMDYQHQFQTYFNYFLQLQQLCSSGCHWMFDGVYGYLAPLQDGLRNLFFSQNNSDFQLWQQAQSVATLNTKKFEDSLSRHDYDVKNFFSRVLDVLDRRLISQDGEIKDIKEKLGEISSKLSSIESQAGKVKISFPGITVIPASSLSKEPSSTTTSPKEPSTPSSTPDVSVSDLSEEDRQGQFLYKVSKKIFDSLKQDSGSDLVQHPKDDVIKGLKDKFKGSLKNDDDTWENFKSLCEAQKQKETKIAPDVDNEYSRLCFGDEGSDAKGDLHNGLSSAEQISSSGNLAFDDLEKKNIELGTSFNNKYPNANPLDKFDEGYSLSEEVPENFREVMSKIISLDYSLSSSE